MDTNEEEGILPILNQVKAFQSKWIAKNKQCETLDSFLTMANAENKKLRDINDEVKSHLKAANIKNKELENTCETLSSNLQAANAKNEKLESECELLKKILNLNNIKIGKLQTVNESTKSCLDTVYLKNKELEMRCETSESALMISNAKIEIIEMKCKDLDVKCAALKSFSNSVNERNKELEIKLDEAKKEVVNATLEKKRMVITTLKKIQNKLLTNPLYAIIDRLKKNIDSLEKAAKNAAPLQRNANEIEVVDIASSDDDDNASTLSYASELRNIEDDFNSSLHFDMSMSPDDDKRSIDVAHVDENALSIPQNPVVSENIEQNQNCNADIRNEFIDDWSCDSNISLSLCTDDVSSTTGEEVHSNSSERSLTQIAEEHSYSDRAPNPPEELLPESTSLECTSTIVNQIVATNNLEIDKRTEKDKPVMLLESQDKDKDAHNVLVPVPELVSSNFSEVPNIENIPPLTNQNINISECDDRYLHSNNQIDKSFAELNEKYGKRLKLLNPVVLLTPVEYEREDAAKLVELENSHPLSSSNSSAFR